MSFASVAYWLAAFLTVYAGLFIILAYNEPPTRKNGLLNKLFSPKILCFLFALVYVALAHFSVLSGVAYGVELTNSADCEMLLTSTNSSLIYGENYSGYHWDYDSQPPTCAPNNLDCVNLFHVRESYVYEDSCADRVTPTAVQFLYVSYSWLLYLDLFALVFGLAFLGLRRVMFLW